MFLKYDYKFIYLVIFLQLCYCQRNESATSVTGKKYMVYFKQSPFTKNFQDSWICGGALVTATRILTAAACLVETENIYAIAGYNKYLSAKDIQNDECTRTRKQRVIKIVLATEEYEHPAQQLDVNIGIAVVEKPYNFSDPTYLTYCCYGPQPIFVNFDSKYDSVNTNAIALGWGPTDNQLEFTQESTHQFLRETPTIIVDKKKCTNIFDTREIVYIINKYHLCGSKEIENDTEHRFRSNNDGKMEKYGRGSENDTDENNDYFEVNFGFRKKNNPENNSDTKTPKQIEVNNPDVEKHTTRINVYGNRNARKHFIDKNCQKNLGSPLIKRIDSKEVMLGITSSTIHGECNGPVLYVSTAASSKLIKCLLETNAAIRQLCNLKNNDGKFEIREIDIDWPNSEIFDEALTSQSPIGYINRAHDAIYAKEQQQSAKVPEERLYTRSYTRVHPVPYQGHAYQRARVPPLLARPQYDLGSKGIKKTYTTVEPQSDELSSEEYYKKIFKYDRPYELHENKPQQFNQPPSPQLSAPYKPPLRIKPEYELFPKIFDQSRENHKKPETEPSEPYMAQIEALQHKLARNREQGAKEASFDQILAHLQDPPSSSTSHRHTDENALKMLIDQIIQHNTKHDEPYEENQETSRHETPVASEEILIRPQIPVNMQL